MQFVWKVTCKVHGEQVAGQLRLCSRQLPVGKNPWAAAFDEANFWVTNLGDATVAKLRASDGAVLGIVHRGQAPGNYKSVTTGLLRQNSTAIVTLVALGLHFHVPAGGF